MVSSFQKLIGYVPYDPDQIVGMAITFFLREQDPEHVEFNIRVDDDGNPMGWQINVTADEDNVKEAKEFWVSNVSDKL